MNQNKQGISTPMNQQKEHSTSGGRKTRSCKHSEDQNQEQNGLTEGSTSVTNKNKNVESSIETRTADQALMPKDLSESSAATQDIKKSTGSVVETRHNTRQSSRVSAYKHQDKPQRHDHKQQKVLTEYFQSFPSQSKASTSKLKPLSKNESESSCYDNKGDKGLSSKALTSRTRSGRKLSEIENKDEKTGKKIYDREKEVPGKENQSVETTRRRERPATAQKNPSISKGCVQKTPKNELLKERQQTIRAGFSSSPSSSGQDLGRSKKGKKASSLVSSSTDKNTSKIVKTPELSGSKKSSPKTSPTKSCGSQRETRRTTFTCSKGGSNNTEILNSKSDLKKHSPALTQSTTVSPKTPVPKTPDNSCRQGVHRTPRSKPQNKEVSSPSPNVKMKSPELPKSKISSPKTPVLKPSNISPKKGMLKTLPKRGKVSSPAVSSPIRKIGKKLSTPLVSRPSPQSHMSTPPRSSRSEVRLLGTPRDQCLSVSSSSSSASSSPVRRMRSRHHADRYGEGCSGIGVSIVQAKK